jgi:hypothetical protein
MATDVEMPQVTWKQTRERTQEIVEVEMMAAAKVMGCRGRGMQEMWGRLMWMLR